MADLRRQTALDQQIVKIRIAASEVDALREKGYEDRGAWRDGRGVPFLPPLRHPMTFIGVACNIKTLNGANHPPHPAHHRGRHRFDLSNVVGQLFDPTVDRIERGLKDQSGHVAHGLGSSTSRKRKDEKA